MLIFHQKIQTTVLAKIMTELILERAGPVILRFSTGIDSVHTDLSCKKSKARKLLETYPAMKSVIFQKLIPGNICPDPL